MAQTLRVTDGRTDVAASTREASSARRIVATWDNAPGAAGRIGPDLPPELHDLLASVLRAVAHGERITIGAMPAELSTTVAADQLGISRPTLMKMIAGGDLPSHKVGTHTRVLTSDVEAALHARLERQRQAFQDLRALDESMGLE